MPKQPLAGPLLITLAVLSAGCATLRGSGDEALKSRLLDGVDLLGRSVSTASLSEHRILAVDGAMASFLEEHVPRDLPVQARANRLATAIFSPDLLDLGYDLELTGTAADTFAATRGNCISFSNLTVAMARHVGLSARFHEVHTAPKWQQTADQATLVYRRHVNVFVETGRHGQGLSLDINRPQRPAVLGMQRLSDNEAFAQFYNNIGVKQMLRGDTPNAFVYLKRSLELAPGDGSLWTNLGTLYRRNGRLDRAEQAYLLALRIDPRQQTAMSNLVGLYQQTGNPAQRQRYLDKIVKLRGNDPYYRLYLGKKAHDAGDHVGAREHVAFALQHITHDPRVYELMAAVEAQLNNVESAQFYLDMARDRSLPQAPP